LQRKIIYLQVRKFFKKVNGSTPWITYGTQLSQFYLLFNVDEGPIIKGNLYYLIIKVAPSTYKINDNYQNPYKTFGELHARLKNKNKKDFVFQEREVVIINSVEQKEMRENVEKNVLKKLETSDEFLTDEQKIFGLGKRKRNLKFEKIIDGNVSKKFSKKSKKIYNN
jgi:hypothetical protein